MCVECDAAVEDALVSERVELAAERIFQEARARLDARRRRRGDHDAAGSCGEQHNGDDERAHRHDYSRRRRFCRRPLVLAL